MSKSLFKQVIADVSYIEDFEIEFTSGKNVFKLGDKFSVDMSEKKITFEKF